MQDDHRLTTVEEIFYGPVKICVRRHIDKLKKLFVEVLLGRFTVTLLLLIV
jgi:hypothetical protein